MSKIIKITAFFCILQLVSQGIAIAQSLSFPLQGRESCKIVDVTETKYQANDDCTYKTLNRTCCKDGKWSVWGNACTGAMNCYITQCWNGKSCTLRGVTEKNCTSITNGASGTLERTANCVSGTGWEYGSWTGTCICKSGYVWTGGACVAIENTDCSSYYCPSGKVPTKTSKGCCCENQYPNIQGYLCRVDETLGA